VGYVGDAKCAECHPAEAETYRRHPMARTSSPIPRPDGPEHYDRAARNPFDALGLHYAIDRQPGRILHREQRRDDQGHVRAEVEAEAAYVIGSGEHGCSYVVNRDGYLFASPIAWYSQRQIWDLAPNYGEH